MNVDWVLSAVPFALRRISDWIGRRQKQKDYIFQQQLILCAHVRTFLFFLCVTAIFYYFLACAFYPLVRARHTETAVRRCQVTNNSGPSWL